MTDVCKLSIADMLALPTPTGPGAVPSLIAMFRKVILEGRKRDVDHTAYSTAEARFLRALATTQPTSLAEEVVLLRFVVERLVVGSQVGTMPEDLEIAHFALTNPAKAPSLH